MVAYLFFPVVIFIGFNSPWFHERALRNSLTVMSEGIDFEATEKVKQRMNKKQLENIDDVIDEWESKTK